MTPANLREALADIIGEKIVRISDVSRGSISKIQLIETSVSKYILKSRYFKPEDVFLREQQGLELLRQTKTLRIPEVFKTGELTADRCAYLLLEYIEPHTVSKRFDFRKNFAAGLASLHRDYCAVDKRYGLSYDNYIGVYPQKNTQYSCWIDFYLKCRLVPQIKLGKDLRRINKDREALLSNVLENLDSLLEGLVENPSLLHGDLWSGNFICHHNQAVLIDPAVYYGHREMECAFIEMFGGFPENFIEAYSEVYPLDDGYPRRRPLHQLSPLLVHLTHF